MPIPPKRWWTSEEVAANVGKVPVVNAAGDGFDWVTPGGGSSYLSLVPDVGLQISSPAPDSADGVGLIVDSDNALTNLSSRIESLRNDGEEVVAVQSNGGTYIGRGVQDWYGVGLTDQQGLVIARNTNRGDPADSGIDIASFGANDQSTGYAEFEITNTFNNGNPHADIGMFANNGTDDSECDILVKIAQIAFWFYYRGNLVTKLEPTVADGIPAYLLDTAIAHTSGNLFEIKNDAVEKFSIGFDGVPKIQGVIEYADNAAAISGGLVEGQIYRTGDALKIVHA